jgi:autoinducer 2-degrading protein
MAGAIRFKVPGMSKIILQGHIVVADTDLAKVMAELPTHIELTRNEEGCLRFEATQSPEAENVFYVYEEFTDRVAFEAHQQRVKSSDWGKVAANVQRHYQVTEVI